MKKAYQHLITDTQKVITSIDIPRDEKLQQICNLLASEVDVFDWVGFYLVHPDEDKELILGPFSGEKTEHTQISFGQGICGQAAASKETFVVQNVDEEGNYLSCSAGVKAEIVAPVMKDGHFVAELDIDSHTQGSISDELRRLTEDICGRISELF